MIKKLFLVLWVSILCNIAAAQVVTSTVSANWNTNSTWSTNSVPAGTENITVATNVVANTNISISGSGTLSVNGGTLINTGASVTLSASNSSVISISGTTTFQGCLTLSNNATLTVNSGAVLTVGCANFSNNTVIIINTGGTLIINGNMTMQNNNGITANGAVIVNGNVTGSNNAAVSGSGSFSASGTISFSNASNIFGNTSGCSSCTINSSGTSSISPCGFKYSRRIRIDHTKVSGGVTLTNFPVYITTLGLTDQALFKSVANSGHVQSGSGYDIVFFAQDGVTPLSFQMDNYVATTGEYEAWVKLPSLASTEDTYIYMCYGDASITTDQSSTGTWDANTVAVYHFNNSVSNSTSTAGLDGTNNGTTNQSSGKLGLNARNFVAASSQYIDVSPYNSAYDLTSSITVSGWVKLTNTGVARKIIGNENNVNGGWKFSIYSDNKVEFEIRNSSNTYNLNRAGFGCGSCGGGTALSSGTWYHVVGQYSQSGSFICCYVNGVQERNYTPLTVTCGASSGTMKMGKEPFASSDYWNGDMDEIHVSNTIRSAGWIATEYNNQSSPSTFAIIATEPNTWLGTTSTSWTTGTNWSSNVAPVSSTATDVIIAYSASNQPTLNGSKQVGSIIIESGATLTLGAGFSLSVANDVLTCGKLTSASTGTLICNATATTNQQIGGNGNYSLANLTINNTTSSPTVTLGAPVTVSGALALTSGVLNTTSTNLLTLQNGATAPALTSASTSYVNGPMKYQVVANMANTAVNFPIGKGSDCRPVILTLNHTDGTQYNYLAEVFNADAGTIFTNPLSTTIDTLSGVHYWTIDRTDNTGTSQPSTGLNGNQQIRLYFGTNDYVYQGTNLTIVKNTNAAPTQAFDIGGTCSFAGNFSTPQSGYITSTSSPNTFTSFSSFTLGSLLTGWNSLPVDLLSFSANINKQKKVDLLWTTRSETNNKFFTIDRSADGQFFSPVLNEPSKAPNGNSTIKLNYKTTDNEPLSGVSYYRLKQTDYNGKSKTFNTVSVSMNNGAIKFVVYPNPNSGEFKVDFTGVENNHEVQILLVDEHGRTVYENSFYAQEANNTINIVPDEKISKGVYFCTFTVEGIKNTARIVVK